MKYKYKYVNRIKEDESNKDALSFGSYIHKVLELGYKETTLDGLQMIADSERKNYNFSEGYKKSVTGCLKNFLKFNSALGETVCTEYVYEIMEEGDIKLNGIIDRVIRGKNGGILILDYKTSKTEMSEMELFKDSQLQGYVYACSKKFNIPINQIIAGHYYPLTNNQVFVRYTIGQINSYKKNKIDEVWKIRKMKIDDCTANKNKFCNWCGYKSVCPLFESNETITKRLDEKKAKS